MENQLAFFFRIRYANCRILQSFECVLTDGGARMHNLIYDETWSVEDIVKEAHKLIGKKLGEIDKSGWLDPNRSERSDKGRIGNMIQADYFGIYFNIENNLNSALHGVLEFIVTQANGAFT